MIRLSEKYIQNSMWYIFCVKKYQMYNYFQKKGKRKKERKKNVSNKCTKCKLEQQNANFPIKLATIKGN